MYASYGVASYGVCTYVCVSDITQYFYYLNLVEDGGCSVSSEQKTASTVMYICGQVESYSYSMHDYVAIVLTYTRCIKNSNLRKEVEIAIKSKETSSQFGSVRNSYVAIMHQPVTICSTM